MAGTPQLAPTNQFPKQVIQDSVQVQPPAIPGMSPSMALYFQLASSADAIISWGVNTKRRDEQLREFWPTESYLAGAVYNVSVRNSVSDWKIEHKSDAVEEAVTEMLKRSIAQDTIGWIPFAQKFSQDLYTQDNGAFMETIRDEGMDANSRFKGAMAPVVGLASLDANRCQRTGNAEFPVVYTDREGKMHKLAWYQVICFSDYPSSIEKMNGVGICAVSRALRLAQIMRSINIYKDESISGRNVKKIHLVGGVGKSQLEDEIRRTQELANNRGHIRFIDHAILASLDPEKPVSTVTVDLAELPEGFDYDKEMQWYIAGLALDFGVDYQEFAPLASGNIGSASQSMMLHRKSSGKGPRAWMDSVANAFEVYGVLPRGAKMVFSDKNEQEELEKQEVRTKALEEAAIATKIFPRKFIAEDLVKRGIYPNIDSIPEEFWKEKDQEEDGKQPVGSRGGNTIREDAGRTPSGKTDANSGGALRK